MFGHTFIRINSKFNSKLLSYAINYAADADPEKENGFTFALKGLFGGYFGTYSLLPYYDKLKEYRDTENRDIWEYDLDLDKQEVLQMVRHIWELNDTSSYYYFFTENCSYNMLWLLEIARPGIHLREYFTYQVSPLETIFAAQSENIISSSQFRPSKRSTLLKYEKLIEKKYLNIAKNIVNDNYNVDLLLNDNFIELTQKQYILEAAIEYLEYSYSKNKMQKEEHLKIFHLLSTKRATLGIGTPAKIIKPANPLESHRAVRTTFGIGAVEDRFTSYIGVRPTYHDLYDSNHGFLRGTQIEFLDFLLSHNKEKTEIQKATILSISSITQQSRFIDGISWRTKFGWDKESLEHKAYFTATAGVGLSYGNDYGYIYGFIDPLFYQTKSFISGIGGSLGVVLDGYKHANTNLEITQRVYENGKSQLHTNISQNFRISQNIQLRFIYEMIEKDTEKKYHEESFKSYLNLYF